MRKLTDWDFGNEKINFSTPQVNRQKSALNVEVIEIDKEGNTGVFFDKKNGIVTASLDECECKDFHFIGNSSRKSFFPCMHIYRLAIELGLMKATHCDYKAKISMMSSEEAKVYYLSRIQRIGRDYTKWGGWDLKVHASRQQQVRQHRAYQILSDGGGNPSKFATTLESCSCPDFQETNLPCKHIYFLALLRKIELYVSQDDHLSNRDRIL